ncbi:M20/M25/M40 family metallo-hydrolase [Polaribacter sp.]|uniref:M20/M25/M40 family metallo-hydrolase n=1 Tax=Polaribacter sp. TaxID=1920175 RepID=UPI0040474B66
MKKYASFIAILIVLGTIYWSFSDLKPSISSQKELLQTGFSLDSALFHLKNISQKQHYVGSEGHKEVQNYLVSELEKLGFEVEIQQKVAVNKKWFAATNTENIIAKLPGTSSGKALLLLSHYDSAMFSSIGASDAGSGVVTILEGIRAFLAKNAAHKNDIILLFTDAEELGLFGAQAFVKHHPWAKNIGLVLNFEARGSGGPSYMLLETNGKNSKLLSEFLLAKPNFPAANSLMYSIYKMLPNDTDLTVFRANANINGFNFAFIGDHFDYHTAQDSYERLDRESLLHQADYLMTLLPYFANSNLENLNSTEDFVYVNFPFIGMLTFSFSWVLPFCFIATFLFLLILFFGIGLNKITMKGLLKSFVPFLLSTVLAGGISYLLWKLIVLIHPHYKDILHGFTYNGYGYIAAFVFLNLYIVLKIYQYFFKEEKPASLLVAPIFFWLIINFVISAYLKGAGFFIIPVFGALLILAIAVFTNLNKHILTIVFAIASIPTIYIFAPLIKMFPVGLGLKNIFISGILIALVFGLLVLVFFQKKNQLLMKISGVFALIFFGYATFNSGFSEENKKPNSLVYVQNDDEKTAYFGTYNQTLDAYTEQIFNDGFKEGSLQNAETKSKYNTRFRFYKETEFKDIESSKIKILKDSTRGENRMIEFVIKPSKKINRLEFITNQKISLTNFTVNDALINEGKKYTVKKGTFLIYYVANADKEITMSFTTDKKEAIDIIVNEISFDLLSHPKFSIKPRSTAMMPMPFVTNDAIIISKKIKL